MKLQWSEEELAHILQHGKLRKFPKGQIVFSAGDKANEIFFIRKGWIHIYRMTQDGQRVSVGLRYHRSFIGISDIFRAGCTRDCYAEALEQIEVYVIDMTDFRKLLAENELIAIKVQEFLSHRLHEAHTTLLEYACTRTPGRLAMTILNMAEQSGEHKDGKIYATIKLTQEEFAAIIGSSRQTVNILLNSFKRQGYIKMKGRIIEEVDSAKLQKWLMKE